jgi:hypothetical protein
MVKDMSKFETVRAKFSEKKPAHFAKARESYKI